MFGLFYKLPSQCSVMEMLTNTTAGKKTLFRQKPLCSQRYQEASEKR